MTQSPAPEAIAFRAEIRQLLNILVHSLYTEREIFLRELVSNASDALNRLQFVMLTERDVLDPDAELAIRLRTDKDARRLTISDTGIGMTREELVENLGTIAHSGAAAFLESLQQGQKVADVIGQFGVGFYSVFMAADEVRVTSRSYKPGEAAWTWTATGGESYTLEPAEQTTRGTTIEVRLKEDASEFADPWRLKDIIHKHSDFVSFPIYLNDEAEPANQRSALWREPAAKVTDETANAFYKQLTLDFDPPLARAHLNTDAPVQISALLFVPAHAERGPFSPRKDWGLKLYSRKVLIQDYSQDLLPRYLRFVVGVVESEDVPLNVSRETVQASRVMERLRTALAHKVVDTLKEVAAKEPEKYAAFWKEFGPFLKEGLATDPAARERLTPLLRFWSAKPGQPPVLSSLNDYVGRLKPEQRTIYYLLGDDLESVSHSPHLDYFRNAGLEVLYLVDPLDAFILPGLTEYEGFPLRSADAPDLDLPTPPAETPAGEALPPPELEALSARFKEVLGERIKDVRASDRLVDHPVRLVGGEARSREMDRVRRLLDKDFSVPVLTLEVNPRHPLIRNLSALVAAGREAATVDGCIEQLYANSLLVEGLLTNPASMVGRIEQLMTAATQR